MRKMTAILLTACLVTPCAIGNAAANDSALQAIDSIRAEIDAHTSHIQQVNTLLLRLSADQMAEADFSDYDTTDILLGETLYDFAPIGAKDGNIGDVITGEENKIITVAGGKYNIPSVQQYGRYAGLFPNDTVVRAKKAGQVEFICDYADEVPEYQIIKNKHNIYYENIVFEKFPMIKFEDCSNIIFNNCTFADFLDNGIVTRNCDDITFVNCTFTDCGSRMSDETNSGYSIRIAGDADRKSENILIENCHIDHSYGKAISFVGSVDNYTVRNNLIENTAWGGIDYWYPEISGDYVNSVENNTLKNIGFGKGAEDNRAYLTSGVGCAAIFAGMGDPLAKSVVKNNVVKKVVETGIEGPYEVVYHNTIKDTGENSVKRNTGSTEAIFIKMSPTFEQKYIGNNIETRGLRCLSAYSESKEEFPGLHILNNKLSLKKDDPTINRKYSRYDIEINCPHIKRIVISGNEGMMTKEKSVNIYMDKDYTMDYFDLNNPCMIAGMPQNARYCFNINNRIDKDI